MNTEPATIVIKKYANRRLYNTRTSAYVTLEDLAEMVRKGEEFVVQDAKTGEEITRGVLGQIIFDAESRGGGLLPIAFLRQLITLYGGQMQSLVPAYLEYSLASFTREQERFSRQVKQTLGKHAIGAVEDQVRRNMDMFERSMRMFLPYGGVGGSSASSGGNDADPAPAAPAEKDDHLAKDVAALRDELAAMQAKIEALSKTPEPPHVAPAPPLVQHAPEDSAEAEDDDFVVPQYDDSKR